MGVVDVVVREFLLCAHRIQNDWVSRATNLHQILCWAWTFLWGNYSDDSEGLAASSLQWTCSCITSHTEYFCETSNHPGDSAPLQPRFSPLQLLAFPKIKITFEREAISDSWWDLGKYDGQLMAIETCVRSQDAYFEGDWGIIVLCTTCIFFNKYLYFSHSMAGYLLDRPRIIQVKN